MASTAPTSHALAAPLASQPAGTPLIVVLLVGSGTTMPLLQGGEGGFASAFTTTAQTRAGTLRAGQIALPASITPTSISATAVPWVGLGA